LRSGAQNGAAPLAKKQPEAPAARIFLAAFKTLGVDRCPIKLEELPVPYFHCGTHCGDRLSKQGRDQWCAFPVMHASATGCYQPSRGGPVSLFANPASISIRPIGAKPLARAPSRPRQRKAPIL